MLDPAVRALFAHLPRKRARAPKPAAIDGTEFLSIADGRPGPTAATAIIVKSMAEYLERRSSGRTMTGSVMFLDSMSRRMVSGSGTLRGAFKALHRFGLPPSAHWPPDSNLQGVEPPGFLFAYAREFETATYVRLDRAKSTGPAVLNAVKDFLAAGLPVGFGFSLFDSASAEPDLPYPTAYDALVGGQAALAIGYDDAHRIHSERGALQLRGPWGPTWGEQGNGWLPYRYVTGHLARDFWSLLRPDWLTRGNFTSPL